MKLPKISTGVDRMGITYTVEEHSGILPSKKCNWSCRRGPSWARFKDPVCVISKEACKKKVALCKVGCRTVQGAVIAACATGTVAGAACVAAAYEAGNQCYNGCDGSGSSGGSGGSGGRWPRPIRELMMVR